MLAWCLWDVIWPNKLLLMIKTMYIFFCNLPFLQLMKCASVRVPCCGEPCLIKKINILIHDNVVTFP
jgi:hypothetical protein